MHNTPWEKPGPVDMVQSAPAPLRRWPGRQRPSGSARSGGQASLCLTSTVGTDCEQLREHNAALRDGARAARLSREEDALGEYY